MDIKRVKPGMKVKVKDNITFSEKKFGFCKRKTEMKGTIQEVKTLEIDTKRIYMTTPDNIKISFHIDDLIFEVNTPIPKIKPETFDPERLVIE